jgi:hypothetical protein
MCKRCEKGSQRIGEVTSLSVFQLVDRCHQSPVIKVWGPCDVIGGSLPEAILTDAILLRPVRKGPSAQGTNRGLDLREVLETGLAKGKVRATVEHSLILQERLAEGASWRVDQIDQTVQNLHSLDAFTKSSKEASGWIPGHASLA